MNLSALDGLRELAPCSPKYLAMRIPRAFPVLVCRVHCSSQHLVRRKIARAEARGSEHKNGNYSNRLFLCYTGSADSPPAGAEGKRLESRGSDTGDVRVLRGTESHPINKNPMA